MADGGLIVVDSAECIEGGNVVDWPGAWRKSIKVKENKLDTCVVYYLERESETSKAKSYCCEVPKDERGWITFEGIKEYCSPYKLGDRCGTNNNIVVKLAIVTLGLLVLFFIIRKALRSKKKKKMVINQNEKYERI